MKKLLMVLALFALIVTNSFAQQIGLNDSGGIFAGGFEINPSGIGFNLLPMQYDGAGRSGPQSAGAAGALNMVFGIWSWTNDDIFWGVLISGFQVFGLVYMALNLPPFDNDSAAYNFGYFGLGPFIFGMIIGYFRGSSQFRARNAIATGFGGNPLEQISFAPIFNGQNMGMNLHYSMRF